MKFVLVSLTLLSLGSVATAAETLKSDTASVVGTDFASRFDEAVSAIERTKAETQRLRDEAAKTTAKLVGTGTGSKVQ